jgi:hypothetical protein
LKITNDQNFEISNRSSQVYELKVRNPKNEIEIDKQKDHTVKHNEEAQRMKNEIKEKNDQKEKQKVKFKN